MRKVLSSRMYISSTGKELSQADVKEPRGMNNVNGWRSVDDNDKIGFSTPRAAL